MRTLSLASFGLVGAALLAGCPDRNVSEVNPNQNKEEYKDIPVNLNRDLDLLFVVDNSGSMGEEQASLIQNFPAFINVLSNIEGGLPNVHIGVVSSNMGAGPYNITDCRGSGDNGQLQSAAHPVPPATTCPTPNGAYISDVSDNNGGRITNYTSGSLAENFSCIANLGTQGCGFEQHMESMRHALNGSNASNAGFLRDNAYLGVVFIQDEDDCSTQDSTMFDTSQTTVNDPLGPLTSFRCTEFGVDCETGNADPRAVGPRTNCSPRQPSPYMYDVDEYVSFLKSLKSDDSLIVVSGIAGPSDPFGVRIDPDHMPNPQLEHSCLEPNTPTFPYAGADPAVRLNYLLTQFPGRNSFSSICNTDLSDGLTQIADLLREAIGNPCLQGDLKMPPECTVSDVVNPGSDNETDTVLPACNAQEATPLDPTDAPTSTNIPCWHLESDTTTCANEPTHLSLVVERAGAGAPIGTHVIARCVTE